MLTPYSLVRPISADQEKALWDRFWKVCDGDNTTDRDALTSLIKTAPVIVERKDEIVGLWTTKYGKDRFIYIALQRHNDNCCMADEVDKKEFAYMQRRG